MSEDKRPTRSEQDAELEREIRSERTFSLAEAIGRLAGGDLMKGASPVPRRRQAQLEVARYLERNLVDSHRALEAVLLRRVKESEIFLQRGYDQPLATLALVIERVLSSDELLHSFVNEVDREWGRMYLERPFFQKPGAPPHADDPYTFSSVRKTLTALATKLNAE